MERKALAPVGGTGGKLSRLTLVEPVGMSLALEQSLVPNNPRFSDRKLAFTSECIALNLSQLQYRQLARIADSVLAGALLVPY